MGAPFGLPPTRSSASKQYADVTNANSLLAPLMLMRPTRRLVRWIKDLDPQDTSIALCSEGQQAVGGSSILDEFCASGQDNPFEGLKVCSMSHEAWPFLIFFIAGVRVRANCAYNLSLPLAGIDKCGDHPLVCMPYIIRQGLT